MVACISNGITERLQQELETLKLHNIHQYTPMELSVKYKYDFAQIIILMTCFIHNFVHDTTALILWHVWKVSKTDYDFSSRSQMDWLSTRSSLTHWGRDKMAAIFQTTFSNAFPWMKMYEFRLRFHWSLFLRDNYIPAWSAPSHYLDQWWLELTVGEMWPMAQTSCFLLFTHSEPHDGDITVGLQTCNGETTVSLT